MKPLLTALIFCASLPAAIQCDSREYTIWTLRIQCIKHDIRPLFSTLNWKLPPDYNPSASLIFWTPSTDTVAFRVTIRYRDGAVPAASTLLAPRLPHRYQGHVEVPMPDGRVLESIEIEELAGRGSVAAAFEP